MSYCEVCQSLKADNNQLKGRVRFLEKECALRVRQRENALERVMPYQDQLEREREAGRVMREALEKISIQAKHTGTYYEKISTSALAQADKIRSGE